MKEVALEQRHLMKFQMSIRQKDFIHCHDTVRVTLVDLSDQILKIKEQILSDLSCALLRSEGRPLLFSSDSGTIKGENREKELTLRNGKLLLEKLKAECDCRSDLFTIFSAKELKNATNDYAENLYSDRSFGLYRGYLEGPGLPVLVKQYVRIDHYIEIAINDVVMASQVNKHNNMLKFLGCCLETDRGDVYAFGTLLLEILLEEKFHTILAMVEQVRGSPSQSSPDLSPPDLSPRIRLFYASDAAPPQTVTAGNALSELLLADPDKDHLWKEVIRAGFMTQKTFKADYQQFMACGELALKCRQFNSHQRPTMMEVALELRRIINFQTSTLRKCASFTAYGRL
ncbi:hypothetical protein RJ641_035267 [Dillenia turbinata]|uniref:Protein kinase domain-containing protein n=1 Tax=Dillenia turbinata TaxID=194707 RepID=A0AAN8VX44_9MAGN